jgi:hypothetical protein
MRGFLRSLTPIIPLVVYHGAKPWTVGKWFHDRFVHLHDDLRPLTAQFRYELIDLGHIDDENLSGDLRQRANLLALKLNARPDMLEAGLPRMFPLLAALPEVDVSRIMRYILLQHPEIGRDDLDRALLRYAPELKERVMNGFLQEIFSEGEAKGKADGLAEGEARGEARGKAEALLKLLFHRFGELPQDVEATVRKADVQTLDRWFLRILEAKSLMDVVGN